MWQDIIVWVVVLIAIVVALAWGYKRIFCKMTDCDHCTKKCSRKQ